jgi:hypothetical protein
VKAGVAWEPLASTQERLLDLYRNAPKTERCACGGSITATPMWVGREVRAHNETAQHQAWRAAQ